MKIAVVGGGIAGLGVAWLLAPKHEVVIYESDRRAGGHARTIDVPDTIGQVAADVGFLVFNEPNYPHFTALMKALSVETTGAEMSFAVSLDGGDYEYGSSLTKFVAQRRNLFRPAFWRMSRDILRFNHHARSLLAALNDPDLTIGAFVDQLGLSADFKNRYLLPMAACIWSAPMAALLAFPACTFVRFFENHGLLTPRPTLAWRTVRNGSRNYVDRLCASLHGRLRLGTPVTAVIRSAAGVVVHDAHGQADRFDRVVMACHADQAIDLLADADEEELAALGAFTYARNEIVLHRDPALMPRRRKIWSSWNYVADAHANTQVHVTYWINRIQELSTSENIFVSVNPTRAIPDRDVIDRMAFDHPLFNSSAIVAQRTLAALQDRRCTFFCGSYCGYGFHEDALRSAVSVSALIGIDPPWTLGRTS
jgi:predicted NAD/FAD-binding protein